MLLIDGGVLNSAPVEAAWAAGAEVTVLVDIHRPLKRMPPEKIKSAFQIVQRTVDVAAAASFDERAVAPISCCASLSTRASSFLETRADRQERRGDRGGRDRGPKMAIGAR